LASGDPKIIADYEIVALLGRGAMGAVYLGRDREGGWAAVKTIRPDLDQDEQYRARFVNEVRNASRISSPFVPSVLAYGEDEDKRAYLVTEFIDGHTLEEALDGRTLDRNGLLQLAVNVLHAIIALHDAGIVHRDIKPQNIIMSGTGPRLIDFGVSRALTDGIGLTNVGSQPGSAATMAPEQWLGGRRTTASDVFAWGCVVIRAGTGRYPFAAEDPDELRDAVLNDEPNVAGLDPPLRTLVAQALRKDPADRPSAADLLHRLLAAAHGGAAADGSAAADGGAAADTAAATEAAAEQPAAGGPPSGHSPPAPRPPGLLSAGFRPWPGGLSRRWRTFLSAAVAFAAFTAFAGVAWLGLSAQTSDKPADVDALSSRPFDADGSDPGRIPGAQPAGQPPGRPPPFGGPPPPGPQPPPAMVEAARGAMGEANRVRRSDPALARRLDLAAFRLAALPEAGAGLMRYGFAIGTLAGPVGRTAAIAVNADATMVAAGAADGTTLLWNRSEPGEPRLRVLGAPDGGAGAAEGGVHSVAFSPLGTVLATGGRRGVRLFDTHDAGRTRILAADGAGGKLSLAFQPGGGALAVAGFGTDVRIYADVEKYLADGSASPRSPRRLSHPDTVSGVAFRSDGQTLATGDRAGVIRLWNPADAAGAVDAEAAAKPRVLGDGPPVTSLAFSPFGDYLVSGHDDGAVRMWGLGDRGGPPFLLHGRDGAVTAVRPGGSPEIMAIGGDTGAVRLWHLADGDASTLLLRGNGGANGGGGPHGGGVAFSGDGRTLAAGSPGEGVRLWNLEPLDVVTRLCAAGNADLTPEEWSRHVTGVEFRRSCP
jgi:WD40 repeat protein/predicted Ser/Thr protein kinase